MKLGQKCSKSIITKMIVRPVLGREFCGVCVNYINNKNAQKPTFITENNVSQHVLIWTSTLVLMWQINVVVVVVCCCVNAGYCCQSLVLLTADLRPALEPYLLLSALYGVFRLLPDLCRLPLGPEPEGVRVLRKYLVRMCRKYYVKNDMNNYCSFCKLECNMLVLPIVSWYRY